MSEAVERFEGRLLQYALRIVGDVDEARDLVQETFLRLCREDPALLNGRLAPWLYTVCRRAAVDVLRKRRLAPGSAGDWTEWLAAAEPALDPAETAAKHDELQLVLEHIRGLPPRQEECVRLKFQHELSYQEISEITGLSPSNVGFLIHTGLKTVRERLARRPGARPLAPPTPQEHSS